MTTLPAPPALRTPEPGAVIPLDAAVFQWDPAPGASAAYALQVATDEAFTAPVVEVADLPTTELALAHALPAGQLWWRVRAGGDAWGPPSAFTSGTPADIEVVRRAEAGRARHERLAARDARQQSRRATSAAPPEPVWPHPSGPALDPAAAPTDWAAVSGFGPPDRPDEPAVSTAPPVVLGPLGGEVVEAATVTFRWSEVPGAAEYDVEVSPGAAFERDVLAFSAGAATEVALQGMLPPIGARLHWRVRARTGGGRTAWSRYGRFYAAGADAAEQFQHDIGVARDAKRRRRGYDRLAAERDLDLLPAYEHADAVSSATEAGAVVLLGGVCIAVALGLIAVGLFVG